MRCLQQLVGLEAYNVRVRTWDCHARAHQSACAQATAVYSKKPVSKSFCRLLEQTTLQAATVILGQINRGKGGFYGIHQLSVGTLSSF